MEMTSQFNIHIFPWGNIGELGYTGDFHLIESSYAFKVSFEPVKAFMFRQDRELNRQPNYVFKSKVLLLNT